MNGQTLLHLQISLRNLTSSSGIQRLPSASATFFLRQQHSSNIKEASTTTSTSTTTAIMTPPHHFDAYWRLNTYDDVSKSTLLSGLQAKGLAFKSSISKEELVEVQQRLDRGLLHYNDVRITEQQLSTFIRARKLRMPTSGTRKAMVAVLLGADEVIGLDKLDQLPAQLRDRIYKFHIGSLPIHKHLGFPTQPPITSISTLLRKEALPLFYSSMYFKLHFVFANTAMRWATTFRRADFDLALRHHSSCRISTLWSDFTGFRSTSVSLRYRISS